MRIRAILSSLSPSTFFISVGALSLAKFLPNRALKAVSYTCDLSIRAF